MPVISSKAPRRAAAVLAVSVAVLFTAACGSDDAATDSGTAGADGPFAAYLSCLDRNGVTITMPSGFPDGARPSGLPDGARPSGLPDGARPSGLPDGARPSGLPDGARPSGFPDGVRPSGAPGGVRPSGQPRSSGSAGQRGGGGFPGGGGFGKPAGVDDATWAKAQEACASVRPSTGAGGGNRGDGNRGGATAAYDNCLKENGVTDTANPDTTDATVKKAVETCAVLKPAA